MPNLIRNQKYSIFTFLPIVLFNQFKLFFNLFFLLTSLSQFIPALKVGYLFAFMAPLGFVLGLTMIKEAVEDFIRYRRDREANSSLYKVLTPSTQYVYKPSSALAVGDILEVPANTRVPADLVLLYTNNPAGTVFIRTDQLDGETDWKLRLAVPFIQKSLQHSLMYKNLASYPAYIETPHSNENIYEFTGTFVHEPTHTKESLGLEHTLWAGTVLATGKALGLVVFCGRETKMQRSAKTPKMKFGRLDLELNFISVLLFVLMVLLSFAIVLLSGMPWGLQFFVVFFRFVLLLSSIIPISMKVNLEIAKLVYCYKIAADQEIKGTVPRNMNIPEELGKIQFLLTDKTGTLTKNEMVFKKLQLSTALFQLPTQKKEILKLLKMRDSNSLNINTPNKKTRNKNNNTTISNNNLLNQDSFSSEKSDTSFEGSSQTTLSKRSLDNHGKLPTKGLSKRLALREAVLAMSLCHNVTPIYEDEAENLAEPRGNLPKKVFQASSPDEIALVSTAEELGYSLIFRDNSRIVLSLGTNHGNERQETYKILALFPFSSENKRMGILLRHKETRKICFYVKGADAVIKEMVSPQSAGFISEECENLSREGLRTLVFAKKTLSEEEYAQWAESFKEASTSLVERDAKMRVCVENLEKSLEFVALTGVEDLLQDNVAQSLENFRQAGINIWMLTGDKVATAICIGISAGIKAPNQELFVIKEQENAVEIQKSLLEFNSRSANSTVLVIDGNTLKKVLEDPASCRSFFDIAVKAPAVICCRCSPTQKTLITQFVKKFAKKIVMAVGDGGNDVGMIQSADVGVGIVGKEGKQASLAADFSIEKFEYLNKLLFWHGRLSYKRSAMLSQFIIHRGLIISFIQAIFSCVFYFVAISIFNGTLLLGYSTFYTMFPVFCLIFDEDITVETAMSYPPLYKTLQRGRDINVKTFLEWTWKSLYQAIIIMWLSLYVFDHAFLKIVTITFSCLILTEFLNLYTVLNSLHIFMIVSQVFSVLIYFLSIWTLRSMLDVSYISWMFLLKVLVITAISFVPLYVLSWLRRKLDPTDYEKVMRNVKTRRINMRII